MFKFKNLFFSNNLKIDNFNGLQFIFSLIATPVVGILVDKFGMITLFNLSGAILNGFTFVLLLMF